MEIYDETDAIRRDDAQIHDEVMVMIGDPDTGRPLLTLSVTKDGHGIIEYDDEIDLAAGIVQLNQLLSRSLRGEIPLAEVRTIQ